MFLRVLSLSFIVTYFGFSASSAYSQVGFVLDCYGVCEQETKRYNRRLSYDRPIELLETLKTGAESSLWIQLIDGNLIRMAAHTMIEIKELVLNFDEKSSHVAVEVHQGHVMFLPRTQEITEASKDSFKELFPLADAEANIFWDLYRYNETQSEIEMSLKNAGFLKYRLEKLQNLVKLNNSWFEVEHPYLTIQSPNLIVQSYKRPVDFVYSLEDGAVVGSREGIEGIDYPKNKMRYYLPLAQYKSGEFDPGKWYQLLNRKDIKPLPNDLGVLEYQIYLKSLPSVLKARENFLVRYKKKILEKKNQASVKKSREGYLTRIQKQPFNFKASVLKGSGQKSLLNVFNHYFIKLNRGPGPELKEPSLVNIFQTVNQQKREWLAKKELGDVREFNRKTLIDFGKSKSKKKSTL